MEDEFKGAKKYLAGWWFWVVLLVVVTAIIFGALNAAGLVGRTALDRVVFEQSHQKKAGDAAKLNMLIAERAQLQSMLRSQSITESDRAAYEAQLAGLNIQINSIKGN